MRNGVSETIHLLPASSCLIIGLSPLSLVETVDIDQDRRDVLHEIDVRLEAIAILARLLGYEEREGGGTEAVDMGLRR
jgi:hypothetical protein